MRINNNLGAMNTYSKLTATNSLKERSLEKLSSGLRINRAADDAAGLAISEKMRAQIKGLNQAGRNAQDGVSLIQTAEGGLSETHSMLQRMRELAVQGANGTLSDEDKTNIQTEIDQLKSEMDKISSNTKFNNKNLLDGTLGVKVDNTAGTALHKQVVEAADNTLISDVMNIDTSGVKSGEVLTFDMVDATSSTDITLSNSAGESQTIKVTDLNAMKAGDVLDFKGLGVKITLKQDMDLDNIGTGAIDLNGKTITTTGTATDIQVGANSSQTMAISINNMTASGLGVDGIDVSTDAAGAIDLLDTAISNVSTERAKLGAYQNRLEHTMNNLSTSAENLTGAESRIRDVDMAKEMMEFTKNNILSQAATSMLAQANQSSQGVLQLLR